MKKITALAVLVILAAGLLAGCAKEDEKEPENTLGSPNDSELTFVTQVVDIDLTAFSTSMAYATMVDLLSNPEEYTGKVIKANGFYEPFYFEGTGRYHHLIEVEGPDGCCPQYFEFVLSGDRVFPDEYPETFAAIQIVGVFGIYEEAGYTLIYLEVDDIKIF
jgi:hypothetical protein